MWIGRSSGTTRHAGFSSATDDLGQRRSDGPHPDGAAARAMAARHQGRVELVPTDEGEGRGRFRAAVLGLLEGLADDAWVYWCIDDKYPMWLDHAAAEDCRRASRSAASGSSSAAGRRSPAGFSMRSQASAAETHAVRRASSPAVIASGLAPPQSLCHARAAR